jgi:hypothetical protein
MDRDYSTRIAALDDEPDRALFRSDSQSLHLGRFRENGAGNLGLSLGQRD